MTNPETISQEDSLFCCQHSRSAGEQLFGSIKPGHICFLLEYPYPWGEKAFEESTLDSSVKNFFSNLLASTPDSKLLFIKNQKSLSADKITFFICIIENINPRLYRFRVDSYPELTNLDVSPLLSTPVPAKVDIYSDPVYLVCTNGKRDRCCAKYGLPVYDRMSAYLPEAVWQCTHVGGHRFAANVIHLPYGIYYGRVREGQAKELIDITARGDILLNKYRGRACFDPVVQAAEYFLRINIAENQIDAIELKDMRQLEADSWLVKFSSRKADKEYRLQIVSEASELPIYASCRADEASPVTQYRLVDFY
jgi:hypothetical protein